MNKEIHYFCLWNAEIDHDDSFDYPETWNSKYHLETTNYITNKDKMFAQQE